MGSPGTRVSGCPGATTLRGYECSGVAQPTPPDQPLIHENVPEAPGG